ncbi:MAG: hypothetical protein JEZ11_05610 [Desulfobacterales bacterium]|nr:hypothetical protein [Desulfobacterales bacterium]
MKECFHDLLQLDDVHGIMFFQHDGAMVYSEFRKKPPRDVSELDWPSLLSFFTNVQEAELVFEKARFCIRQTESGFLVIVTGPFALISMVRLNCAIILPTLEKSSQKSKGFKRFFTRK